MKLIVAFLVSNLLGVLYDFLYKMIFPYNIHKHKPYLYKLSDTFIQLLLNTFGSFLLSLRILRRINYITIRHLIRALIQIGIFLIFYEYLRLNF